MSLATATATVPTDPWGDRLSAASLVALAPLTALALLLLPADADIRVTDTASARSALDAAASHRLGSWIGLLVVAVLYLLLIPGLMRVVRLVPGRGRAWVRAGQVLVSVGACALAIENAIVGISLRAATTAGLDRGAMVDYTVALQREHGPLAPLLWFALAMFVGAVALAIGIMLSTTLPWWYGLLVLVALFGLIAAAPGLTGVVECLLLAAVAWALLRAPVVLR
jgi:hypothetical protein